MVSLPWRTPMLDERKGDMAVPQIRVDVSGGAEHLIGGSIYTVRGCRLQPAPSEPLPYF